MRKFLLLAGAAVCAAAIFTQLAAKPGPFNFLNATFSWDVTIHDFGKVPVNVPVTTKFTFKNTGDTPLVIASVKASCGCTVTEYSKDPIDSGAEGFVKATYNAATLGQFTKTVTVNANTNDQVVQLTIKGEVVQ